MRKLLSWSLAVMMALSALVAATPIASANFGTCTQLHPYSRVEGIGARYVGAGEAGLGAYGVAADLNPANASNWGQCSSGTVNGTGTFLWVGLTYSSADEDTILQAGVARCLATGASYPFATACRTTNQWHFFVAYGGCGAYEPWPLDLGIADASSHRFVLNHYTANGGEFRVYIDGTRYATIDDDNPGISCWIDNHQRRISIQDEEWDANDSLGTNAVRAGASNIQVTATEANNWSNYNPGACDDFVGPDPYGHCVVVSGNNMQMWDDGTI